MPDKSSVEPGAPSAAVVAPAPAAPLSPSSAAAAAAGNDRFVARRIGDVFGLANSLYEKSPAVLKYGVDQFLWASRPVVNKVNPLAQRAVSLADDGVDYVQSKLHSGSEKATTAAASVQSSAAELKQSAALVSKQWFDKVDGVLVSLHPTLAANVYFVQAVEQFKSLFGSVNGVNGANGANGANGVNGASGAHGNIPPFSEFVAKLKASLAALWDERLTPLTKSFYDAAKARYAAGAKTADDAVTQIKATLGSAWVDRVTDVFASRVGTPSRDIYNRTVEKFVALYDSGKLSEIKTPDEFVRAMKNSLGALWTDQLKEPIVELYNSIKLQSEKNAANVRAVLANQLNREAVTAKYTSLTTALSTQVSEVLSRASASAQALSHWTIRKLYLEGSRLVYTAVDGSRQRALQASAFTLDLLLPRGEGEELPSPSAASASPASPSDPIAAVPAVVNGDNKEAAPVSPSAATPSELTLRVLRARAAARVRARVDRAVKYAGSVAQKSDEIANKTGARLGTLIGVNAYAEAKEFVARTNTLVAQLKNDTESYAHDTSSRALKDADAVKELQLTRVRAALSALNTEFTKQSETVSSLLAGLERRVGTDGVRKSAVSTLSAKLKLAIEKLRSLSGSAASASDYVLDRELAAFPADAVALVRRIPSALPSFPRVSLPGPIVSLSERATAKFRGLFASLSEAVKAIAAYTNARARAFAARVAPSSSSSSASAAPAPAASSSSSASASASAVPASPLSLTPNDSPAATPATGVKQIAAKYDAAANANAVAASSSSKKTPVKSAPSKPSTVEDDSEKREDDEEADAAEVDAEVDADAEEVDN